MTFSRAPQKMEIFLNLLTWAAIILCRSWINSHLGQRQLRYMQCFLWPRSPEITPWLRHLAHFGTLAQALFFTEPPLLQFETRHNLSSPLTKLFVGTITQEFQTFVFFFQKLRKQKIVSKLSTINLFNFVNNNLTTKELYS